MGKPGRANFKDSRNGGSRDSYFLKYYLKNRKKAIAYSKAKHPRKKKDSDLRWAFGISLQTYEQISKSQQGKCAICRGLPGPHYKYLSVDHDHKSKEIRGLLCTRCNMALGLLKDCPQIIKGMIKYLTRKIRYGKINRERKRRYGIRIRKEATTRPSQKKAA